MSYYTKITKAGLAAITTAMNNNSKVPITYMAFGDGNGYIPEPDENATSLVNEVYRVGVNKVEVHNKNPNWLVCEAIIPSAVGGFNIREVALYDSTGNTMLAIASYPPTYKPTVEEGAAKIQTIRIVIQVDNSGNFELIVDPDVVLATIEYLNNFKIEDKNVLLKDGRNLENKLLEKKTPYDFGAVGRGSKITLDQWTIPGSIPFYKDLSAIQVDYPHVTSLDDYVDWAAFQKFLDYVKNTPCEAIAFGYFYINKPLNFLRNRENNTRVIQGDITLTTDMELPYMLRLTGLFTKWTGYINLQAEYTGGTDYVLRKVKHGLILGGFEEGYTSLGISVDEVRVHGVKEIGVFCREWSMFAKIGSVRASACGFGAKYDKTRIFANWSNKVENGLSDFSQRTTINVDVLPPQLDSDSTILVANINNEPYKIESVDRINKTITVFPKIDNNLTSGQLYYVGGGAFAVDGANSNCVKVDLLSAVSSGIGCYNRSFYDLQISRLVSEANGIGYAHGKISTQVLKTVVINNFYNETDSWLDILNASLVTSGSNINIVSSSGLNEEFFKNVISYRLSNNTLEGLYGGVGLSNININEKNKSYLKLPDNKTEVTKQELTLEVCDPKNHVYRKNSWVFNLSCNERHNRLYGWDSTLITVFGTGTNNKPTGEFTFKAPTGWTVNGVASVTLSDFDEVLNVALYAHFSTKNILLTSNKKLSNLVSLEEINIPASSRVELSEINIPGAVFGKNIALVSVNKALGVDAKIWAEIISTNKIKIYIENNKSTALDLGAITIQVKII